jgi:ribonuclease VapC
MFLDASALVAMMTRESDAEDLAKRIEQATTPLTTSGIAILETALAYARKEKVNVDQAVEAVHDFLRLVEAKVISITPEISKRAYAAAAHYGPLSGHRARLNLGDAFAYGCAKSLGVPLLYKGDDFSHTDLA